ncbi:imidazole glycerol phosphate synthase subunit HisF [Oceanobacillus neutriphilus]|uniref:Imidazole glycerol phosphate synthase subunit HisF n=1 Tax=Oceanobacillus neutriphilus TaxID=531815 RepID=A0ABQ2P0P1_9BACI|nr:imidazole glycerol phosphate synthase subunit HisF [Oceanobacillus neutriphilus]GGP14943.1 imidazole glycerol phosphate synthase subunit HisF [Oceanobacillus neutriphilus]
MLAKRIIPCLDVDKGRVVKGKKFQDIKDVANPVELAARYNREGADELVFYDITASNEERNIFLDVVEQVAREIAIPFMVGGGIRTIEDIHSVLHAGADKVSVNSAAVQRPELIKESSDKFGSQCIVLSIDAKKTSDGDYHVFINGGRKDTGMDAIEWAKQGEALGAGELVVNAMDSDGEKKGYQIELTKKIADAVNIPVIASGGAGKYEHFSEVFAEGIDAALAASVFHYEEIPIPELKEYLSSQGIPMRRRA